MSPSPSLVIQRLAQPPPAPDRRILVVDDDDDIRGLLRALIERGPYRVVEAVDGETALASIARTTPDLIVLDINMPDIDGTEVCRRVKAGTATRHVPIVMLTAAGLDEQRQRSLAAGADAYLTKPFSPLALLDLVEKHLGVT